VAEEEAFRLDRARVRSSFERASATYEPAARLQAQVGEELLTRLEAFPLRPRAVLDLGAGTGRFARALKRRYPRALVVALDLSAGMLHEARRHSRPWRPLGRVCADALRLPLAAASVDVVYSNLMLQWCAPPDPVFAEVRRVLRPEGFFAFSTFGPATLGELRAAWAQADDFAHVHHFADVHDVGDALVRAGLMEPVLDVDRVELGYADVLALMRELKTLGARNASAGRPRTLLARAHLERVRRGYEVFRRGGTLPATFEVIYGAAWGAAGRTASAFRGGEALIAPGSIGRGVHR
jgi:malonyl-CoA O-methyltransferase